MDISDKIIIGIIILIVLIWLIISVFVVIKDTIIERKTTKLYECFLPEIMEMNRKLLQGDEDFEEEKDDEDEDKNLPKD